MWYWEVNYIAYNEMDVRGRRGLDLGIYQYDLTSSMSDTSDRPRHMVAHWKIIIAPKQTPKMMAFVMNQSLIASAQPLVNMTPSISESDRVSTLKPHW